MTPHRRFLAAGTAASRPAAAQAGWCPDRPVRLLPGFPASRSRSAPNVPTFAEIGVPGVEVSSWQGLFGPAGLPKPALRRWNAAANEVLRDADAAAWLAENAAEPVGGTPEEFAAFLASERARWAAAVRDTGIALD